MTETAQDPRQNIALPARAEYPGARQAWSTVAVVTTLYWLGTLDRQMSVLLVTPIKEHFQLSDVGVSLIHGLAFPLFYMLASLPVGWMVDRFRRRKILFWGALVWASAAVAGGLARSFGQLFAARAGVGAGESTLQPTTFSILADLFPPGRLSLPLSIFVIGGTVGSGMSFILGGELVAWVNSQPPIVLPFAGPLAGWQFALIVTGFPGLLVAGAIFLVPEPPRTHKGLSPHVDANFSALGRQYRKHPRFYLTQSVGFALVMMLVVGLGAWSPAFLSREHGWEIARIGRWLGVSQILSALLGLAFHGAMVDRLFRKGRHDAHMAYFMVMSILAGPLAVAAYLVDNAHLMLLLYSLAYFCIMAYPAIGPAALQITTPPALRGKASSVYMICVNLIGAIGGPLIIAMITDYGFRSEADLGLSMSLFAGVSMLVAAVLFRVGMAPMRRAVASQLSAG